MKNKLLAGSLMLLALGLSTGLQASENDCFPACPELAKPVATIEVPAEVKLESATIIAPRGSGIEPVPNKPCDTAILCGKQKR